MPGAQTRGVVDGRPMTSRSALAASARRMRTGFPSRTMRRRWIPCTEAASRIRPRATTASARASLAAMNAGGRTAIPVS